jgi:hypothetical protein
MTPKWRPRKQCARYSPMARGPVGTTSGHLARPCSVCVSADCPITMRHLVEEGCRRISQPRGDRLRLPVEMPLLYLCYQHYEIYYPNAPKELARICTLLLSSDHKQACHLVTHIWLHGNIYYNITVIG